MRRSFGGDPESVRKPKTWSYHQQVAGGAIIRMTRPSARLTISPRANTRCAAIATVWRAMIAKSVTISTLVLTVPIAENAKTAARSRSFETIHEG